MKKTIAKLAVLVMVMIFLIAATKSVSDYIDDQANQLSTVLVERPSE